MSQNSIDNVLVLYAGDHFEGSAAATANFNIDIEYSFESLAPNHRWRGEVTPAKRGKDVKRISNDEVRSTVEHHAAMTWAEMEL